MKYAKILKEKHFYTSKSEVRLFTDELITIQYLNKLRAILDLEREVDYTIISVPRDRVGYAFGKRIEIKKGNE